MAKVTSGYFTDMDAPELRFEEPGQGGSKRAGNHVMPVNMPAYSVEDERYAELNDKKANMLRYQQELEKTQREVREMEARRAKEERFNLGRRDICERLARDLSKLEGDLYNAQKAVEEIGAAREVYQHHLDTLRSVQPDGSGHADDEMDRAIGAVEDAESEFRKTSRRLATVLPQLGTEGFVAQSSMPQTFQAWLRAGAAFSIPLTIASILVALLLKFIP
jgi:hypothetical protein